MVNPQKCHHRVAFQQEHALVFNEEKAESCLLILKEETTAQLVVFGEFMGGV